MSLFITFEGGEGSGKSTQTRALYSKLCRSGIAAVRIREPGGTPLGNKIGEWLKHGREIAPHVELLLFAASRAQLMSEVICPSLEEEAVVVCDRHAESTTAYQGYGRGLDLSLIGEINRLVTKGVRPDLIVFLNIDPKLGLARKPSANGDRFEREDIAFHRRVREGYLEMASAEPERWLVIDATLTKERISELVWQRVKLMLDTDGRRR